METMITMITMITMGQKNADGSPGGYYAKQYSAAVIM
jgi:hypothetical protein